MNVRNRPKLWLVPPGRANELAAEDAEDDARHEAINSAFRDRRRQVNDEQAWEDMTRGTPADVSRETHQPPPALGVGLLLGLGTVALLLAAYFAIVAVGGHP